MGLPRPTAAKALPGHDYAFVMSGDLKIGVYEGECTLVEGEGEGVFRVRDRFRYADPVSGGVVTVEAKVLVGPEMKIRSGTITRTSGDMRATVHLRQEGAAFIKETTRRGRTRRISKVSDGVTYLHLGLRRVRLMDWTEAHEETLFCYLPVDNITRSVTFRFGEPAARDGSARTPLDVQRGALAHHRQHGALGRKLEEHAPSHGSTVPPCACGCGSLDPCSHGARPHSDQRCAGAQPERDRRHDPEEEARRADGCVGLG